jgi:hypothetical protein
LEGAEKGAMDFPAYVPAGARAHISWTLEGGGERWQGVNALVAEYRQSYVSPENLASVEGEQTCVLRFAHDDRMRAVYNELQKVFTSDDQYADFLRSAYAADLDFERYRQRVKQAKRLAPKIAEAASALACLLKQAGDVGGGKAPSEFYCIRTLLNATDNHELDDHNLHMWRALRKSITGERREVSPGPQDLLPVGPMKFVLVPVKPGEAKIDPEEQARNTLFYAWENAPDLVAILGTVEAAARNWIPQEGGAIGAAISTRQRSQVSEYVRAFAKLLRQHMPSLEFSAPIVAAMAGVADVVLNDANNVVTADAVSKALIRTVDNSA